MVLDGLVKQRPLARTNGSGSGAPEREDAAPEPGSARWWADRAAAASRRRPRAGGLSTERIVDAALEILRQDGLEALTLRAVANRLGVTSNASLYRHIASRDELIVLIVDHSLSDVQVDRTGRGWRADIEALMHEIRRVILNQPLPISVARSRSTFGPNMLRIVDATLRGFLDAGLTNNQAAIATTTVIEFVAGAANIQRSTAGRRPTGASGAAGFHQLLESFPHGQFTALRTAGADYVAVSADDVFTRGLAIILDGIANQLPSGQ